VNNFRRDYQFGAIYEQVVAEVVCEALWPGATLAQAPTYGDLDWVAIQPSPLGEGVAKLLGALEVKARRISGSRFPSTIVASRKSDAAKAFRAFFKCPSWAAIQFTDNLALLNLLLPPDSEELISRNDRDKAVPHSIYSHERLDWRPDLFLEVQRRVAVLND
jgi:hypothetical protein